MTLRIGNGKDNDVSIKVFDQKVIHPISLENFFYVDTVRFYITAVSVYILYPKVESLLTDA